MDPYDFVMMVTYGGTNLSLCGTVIVFLVIVFWILPQIAKNNNLITPPRKRRDERSDREEFIRFMESRERGRRK